MVDGAAALADELAELVCAGLVLEDGCAVVPHALESERRVEHDAPRVSPLPVVSAGHTTSSARGRTSKPLG